MKPPSSILFPSRTLFILFLLVLGANAVQITQGPFVGHCTPNSASVWARCSVAGTYALTVEALDGASARHAELEVTSNSDLCGVWKVTGLKASHDYLYELRSGDTVLSGGRLRTPPAEETPARVVLAFGSCAREDAGTAAVWKRMGLEGAEGVVLLGDTPYIDTTDLGVQRRRCREFASVREMADLLSGRPWYATWDDHDFGRNDTDGNLAGKERSRRAFVDYHANPSYGNGKEGIYTSFRRGPVEVFLLDTRSFAGTGPSPVDPAHKTLLGPAQWKWLRDRLKVSTAPFKILASGMIWNGAVRPGKRDHWETYSQERDALFRFLGEEKVGGVVLVGGDVHRSRVVRHETKEAVGYDLTELITSPMHAGVIKAANAPHPGLLKDMGEPNSCLILTADTRGDSPSLTARFVNAAGETLHSLELAE